MLTDLAKIEAYIAISEVKARYCRTLDTTDWAGYADVFTEDAELDTRPAGGSLTHGRDAVVSIFRSAVETATTAHQVHSPEITLNGDTADVIWVMQDRVEWGADRRPIMGNSGHTGYGHYHEQYVCDDVALANRKADTDTTARGYLRRSRSLMSLGCCST